VALQLTQGNFQVSYIVCSEIFGGFSNSKTLVEIYGNMIDWTL